MGCGASTTDKEAIKVLPQNAANSHPDQPQLMERPSEPPKTNIPSRKNSPHSQKQALRASSLSKKESLKNSTSASKIKGKESLNKSSSGSPSKGNGLRDSSLGKSRRENSSGRSPSKEDLRSSRKRVNPQDRKDGKLVQTESVIMEEGLKESKRDKQRTIKKVKSVRNNKQLTDLIKIYGL